MTVRATAVNPRILVWARERAGLSPDDVARRMSKDVSEIIAWEQGEKAPTYNQLEHLAERLFRRPVALFFLPEPPDEEPLSTSFRTLPDSELETFEADTRFALRDAVAFQQSLRELTGGENPAERLIARDLRTRLGTDVNELAAAARRYLGVTLATQRAWRGTRVAMDAWRQVIESCGVFVFKRSFEQDEISGFCLDDIEFPVIVVNNSTSFSRQVFTLFHELAHLLFGLNSITTEDMGFLEHLTGTARQIEIACNEFAAEFLVPHHSFPWERFERNDPVAAVPGVAEEYNVSREVILRRLFDYGIVNQQTYERTVAEWLQESGDRAGGTGGNYYATQAAYLGLTFLSLAFSQYRAGNITLPDLAEHLRMKARNVPKLEDFLLRGSASR